MDLREQIEARKRERAAEETDKNEQEALEAKAQESLALERAKRFLRENPRPTKNKQGEEADKPLTPEQHAGRLTEEEIEKSRNEAIKVINGEAGKRVGFFNMSVFILMFGYGVFQLFSNALVGLFFIAGSLVYIWFVIEREKSKLLDEAEQPIASETTSS